MINTVESLRGLYVALGGDIAEVANLNTIPQLLEEISTVAQAAATELPAVKAADNGKVLTVVNSKWAKADLPTELPAITGSDNGKLLKASAGKWVTTDFGYRSYSITISGTTAGGNVQITWPVGMNQATAITSLGNQEVPVVVNCTSLPNDTMNSVICHLVSIADYMNFIFKGYYSYTSGSDTLWNEVTVIIHGAGTATAEVYVKAFTPTDS